MIENCENEDFITGVDIFQCDRLRRGHSQMMSLLDELEKNLLIMEQTILLHKKVYGTESMGPWEQV